MSDQDTKQPAQDGQAEPPLAIASLEKPQESILETFLDEVFDKIWFGKTIKKIFIRDGKLATEGLVVFVVALSLGVVIGIWWDSDKIEKLNGNISDQKETLAETKGALTAMTQERDKYQLMVAPYQAYADQLLISP